MIIRRKTESYLKFGLNLVRNSVHTSYLSPQSPIYRWRKNWSCGEISDFNTQQMWRNQKFCQIWRNFKILHMTDVKKSEIYPVFGCEICFVAIYAIFCLKCFVVIYALLCGKKLSRKLYRWRKNDKYEVWLNSGNLSLLLTFS